MTNFLTPEQQEQVLFDVDKTLQAYDLVQQLNSNGYQIVKFEPDEANVRYFYTRDQAADLGVDFQEYALLRPETPLESGDVVIVRENRKFRKDPR